jgi:hypothetical protein
MRVSKFLINEPFLQVSVSLMLEIGQSKAIVLQKLHSLTIDGKPFLATYKDWHSILSFISDEHLKRILVWLEGKKLIISKKEKGKRSNCYSINFNGLSGQGFEIIGSSIFHKKYQNKKMSFILPSLVNLVGLTSAIFLQDFYYQNENGFSQMTKNEINKWVPYVGFRQIKILFHDLQKKEIIKSEFRDESSKNDGKYYSVDRLKIHELLISSLAESPENGQNHKRSGIVDNSLIVDNFQDQNHKRSPLKPQKIPPKTTKDHPYSIDQDQDKIFKDNNTNTLGRKPDCGTIPEAKDDIVLLRERLMTYKMDPDVAIALVEKYGPQRVKYVVEQLSNRYEKVKPQLLISALEKNYIWPDGGTKMTGHVKPQDSLERRYYEAKAALNARNVDLMMKKRATNEVGEFHIQNIRGKLGLARSTLDGI